MKVYVQEHLNLAFCMNCCGFGHIAKYCKDKSCCYRCGKEHSGKECTQESLDCINCKKMKFDPEDTKHTARDYQCPIYQKKLKQYRNQVNYGGNFL